MEKINIHKNKEFKVHKHHISIVLLVITALILILLLTIKPAYEGYQLKKEFSELGKDAKEILASVENLKSDSIIKQTNLDNQKTLTNDCMDKLKEEQDKRLQADQLSQNLNHEINELKSSIDSNYSRLQIEYNKLKSNYYSTTKYAANNICCKNKVDNTAINSYTISDNKVVCTVDAESKIEC